MNHSEDFEVRPTGPVSLCEISQKPRKLGCRDAPLPKQTPGNLSDGKPFTGLKSASSALCVYEPHRAS